MKDLTIIIPLFNEEESIVELHDWLVKAISKMNVSYEILFIDDGSTDASWAKILSLKNINPSVFGIKFKRNYGKSAALNVGFQNAKGNVVITMDADLQDSPDEIPELYNMIIEENFDLVSGWKKKRFDPLSKTIPTKIYNGVTSFISGIKLHDMNCGLKAYKSQLVKSIEVYGEMHRYIPVIAKWAGFNAIGEKIVVHQPRKYGVTKFGLSRFVFGFLDLFSIMFMGKFGKRPMHFFGSVGLFLSFIGGLILTYMTYTKFFNNKGGLTDRPLFFFGILFIIVGFQLFMTGFIAELVSRNAPDRNNYLIDKTI